MPLGPQKFYNRLDHHHEECKDWVVVNWNLGNMCNFHCTYCPSILNDGSFGWNDFEVVKAFIDNVVEHYAPRKVYFEFTGGEVTLWKDFVKAAQYIKSIGHDIGFISNSSRTIRWWEQHKETFDHVCLSFHPEEGDAEHYLKVVEIMSQQCRTHCNIMMHYDPEIWDKCVDVVERIVKIKNISLALQPLIIDFGETLYSYTQEQLDFIDRQWHDYGSKIEHDTSWKIYRGSMDMWDDVNNLRQNSSAHRFINDKTNDWSGWDCWAGIEQIVVDFDGSVMRGWCRVGGKFGNMKDPENIRWPEAPIRCNKTMCHCNFDIMCKKLLPEDAYEIIEE
jgi:organic radical activating enzyme